MDRTIIFYAILGSLALAAGGVWMIQAAPDFHARAGQVIFGGLVAAGGFGGMALLGLARLIGERGPAISLSPHGLRVSTFSPDVVAWSDILAVGAWRFKTGRGVALTLDPQVSKAIRRSAIARTFGGMSGTKPDVMVVVANGSLTTHNELRELIEAYLCRYGRADLLGLGNFPT